MTTHPNLLLMYITQMKRVKEQNLKITEHREEELTFLFDSISINSANKDQQDAKPKANKKSNEDKTSGIK